MPLLGLGQMLLMASCNTVLQTIVDDDKRGRVMSFYSLSFMGVAPLGNLLAGVAAREFGSAATMAAGGVACVLGAIAFTRRLPRLRTLIRPIYASKGIVTDVAAETGWPPANAPAQSTEEGRTAQRHRPPVRTAPASCLDRWVGTRPSSRVRRDVPAQRVRDGASSGSRA